MGLLLLLEFALLFVDEVLGEFEGEGFAEVAGERGLVVFVVGTEAVLEEGGDDIGALGGAVLVGEVAADHGGEGVR